MQRDRMLLRGPARGLAQQVRQFRADALERERSARSATSSVSIETRSTHAWCNTSHPLTPSSSE